MVISHDMTFLALKIEPVVLIIRSKQESFCCNTLSNDGCNSKDVHAGSECCQASSCACDQEHGKFPPEHSCVSWHQPSHQDLLGGGLPSCLLLHLDLLRDHLVVEGLRAEQLKHCLCLLWHHQTCRHLLCKDLSQECPFLQQLMLVLCKERKRENPSTNASTASSFCLVLCSSARRSGHLLA